MTESFARPPIALTHRAAPLLEDATPDDIATRLLAGEALLLQGSYGQGMRALTALRSEVCPPGADYATRSAQEQRFAALAQNLLAPVSDNCVRLRDVPSNGFLEELYPDATDFVIPLVWVQALHGAWERYRTGVHFPVLGRRLHPHYGVYAPARMVHLELFATWLKGSTGGLGKAVDVGTGCGVIALMLARHGFSSVVATDINPNALVGLRRDIERQPAPTAIALEQGDLLCGEDGPVDLIVFNPPWTKGEVRSTIDQALVFEEGLFERFFDQSAMCLGPDGRVVVIFSTIIRLVQPEVEHPIEAELERGRFVLDERLQRKVKPSPGRRTRERVEVWVLKRA